MIVKALVVRPNEEPRVEELDTSLESLQALVGGYIEILYPFDDKVCVVCNEESKINGECEPNRPLFSKWDNHMYDVIFGTFAVFAYHYGDEDFSSITAEQSRKYAEYFALHKGEHGSPTKVEHRRGYDAIVFDDGFEMRNEDIICVTFTKKDR